jgi:hypothetical protein
MLNAFDIILFTKWCGGLIAKILVWNQLQAKVQSPITNIYYVKYYIHIYTLYMCVNV